MAGQQAAGRRCTACSTACPRSASRPPTGLLTGPGVLAVLVVALLASWAMSQALAYLGYTRLGQDPARRARMLLAGLGAGLEAW